MVWSVVMPHDPVTMGSLRHRRMIGLPLVATKGGGGRGTESGGERRKESAANAAAKRERKHVILGSA
jgi:hypothetical protein